MNDSSLSPARLRARRGRRALAPSGELVSFSEISEGQTRVCVVSPDVASVDLPGWIERNRATVDQTLLRDGAIVFRGFDIDLDADFQQCAGRMIDGFLPYMEGATPRTKLGGDVYTSTEFPSDQTIAPHNELSYTVQWPMRISFACRTAPETGGETPLTDVRRTLENLAPDIVERFRERGWMLVRNFGNGLGPTWQKAFNTSSIETLSQYCADSDIELEILDEDRIVTRQVRPAIRRHPVTGAQVWFNHVAFWHPFSLEPSVRASLTAQFADEELPYYTCWGDGSPISDDVIADINLAYRRATLATPWQANDVMLLDNMLVAHGRRPFSGPRSIIVAMGQPSVRMASRPPTGR